MAGFRRASRVEELGIASPAGLAVTVGNFDGVHVGHQAVLAELVRVSHVTARLGVVVTFDPHPLSVVAPGRAPRLLTPLEERLELVADSGAGAALVIPFTCELAATQGSAFLRLIGVGRGSHVILGYDFHMGRDRSSGIESLRELGLSEGFDLDVVPPVLHEGEAVSSSRIRAAVSRGKVAAATAMLGRPYRLVGAVVSGDGIGGRELGTPTANLATRPAKLLPEDGVYYVREAGSGRPGVLYIGRRPTFGDGERRVEVHLLDAREDLYGGHLAVDVLQRIREDRRFEDLAALGKQIAEDVRAARALAEGRGGAGTGGEGHSPSS